MRSRYLLRARLLASHSYPLSKLLRMKLLTKWTHFKKIFSNLIKLRNLSVLHLLSTNFSFFFFFAAEVQAYVGICLYSNNYNLLFKIIIIKRKVCIIYDTCIFLDVTFVKIEWMKKKPDNKQNVNKLHQNRVDLLRFGISCYWHLSNLDNICPCPCNMEYYNGKKKEFNRSLIGFLNYFLRKIYRRT